MCLLVTGDGLTLSEHSKSKKVTLPGAPADAVCEAPPCALGTSRWGTSLARPLPTNRLAYDVVNRRKQSHPATAQASVKPGDSMGQGSRHQRQMQLRLKVFLIVASCRGVNNNKSLPSIMLRDKTQHTPCSRSLQQQVEHPRRGPLCKLAGHTAQRHGLHLEARAVHVGIASQANREHKENC